MDSTARILLSAALLVAPLSLGAMNISRRAFLQSGVASCFTPQLSGPVQLGLGASCPSLVMPTVRENLIFRKGIWLKNSIVRWLLAGELRETTALNLALWEYELAKKFSVPIEHIWEEVDSLVCTKCLTHFTLPQNVPRSFSVPSPKLRMFSTLGESFKAELIETLRSEKGVFFATLADSILRQPPLRTIHLSEKSSYRMAQWQKNEFFQMQLFTYWENLDPEATQHLREKWRSKKEDFPQGFNDANVELFHLRLGMPSAIANTLQTRLSGELATLEAQVARDLHIPIEQLWEAIGYWQNPAHDVASISDHRPRRFPKLTTGQFNYFRKSLRNAFPQLEKAIHTEYLSHFQNPSHPNFNSARSAVTAMIQQNEDAILELPMGDANPMVTHSANEPLLQLTEKPLPLQKVVPSSLPQSPSLLDQRVDLKPVLRWCDEVIGYSTEEPQNSDLQLEKTKDVEF